MTTSGFGKVGTVFSVNTTDGGVAESSGSRDFDELFDPIPRKQ